jgi:hypothetical protein
MLGGHLCKNRKMPVQVQSLRGDSRQGFGTCDAGKFHLAGVRRPIRALRRSKDYRNNRKARSVEASREWSDGRAENPVHRTRGGG